MTFYDISTMTGSGLHFDYFHFSNNVYNVIFFVLSRLIATYFVLIETVLLLRMYMYFIHIAPHA